MKRIFWAALIFVTLYGSQAIRWSFNSLPDESEVIVCEGESVTLNWSYSTESGETLEDIKWHYSGGNGHGQGQGQLVAMDSEGFFFPSPSFANLVELAANAGLRLNRLTVHNTGDYSVTVSTHRGSRYDAFTLTAHVIVADPPATVTGRLDISTRTDVAVYDNRTREWHIQLTCGDFRRLGQPHVQLEWTTPMGVMNTTQSADGRSFRLLLRNPVVGGNYSCRLHPDSQAARCLYPGHPLLTGDSVHVDETEARFALMRAEQQYLLSENQALHREVDELRRQVEWLMANVGHFTSN